MIASILSSPTFVTEAEELADRLNRPLDDVLAMATAHLREMSATHNDAVVRPWNRFGRWMLRGYDQLIDEEGLARLRALDRENSLVFLISHRSYLDEWVFPAALPEHGIQAPFGFAGANLNFFPLGTVARRTGIMHIRRATADLPVYKLALRAYMRRLVADKANLIWSIEGGRSRTGKLRPPRFGLLRYVIDAVEQLETAEVLLVPVSILYDQLPAHEVDKMTAEARGQSKTPEDVRWFLGYLRGLRHRLGRVYVDFGEPLALTTRLAELKADSSAESTAVERIAVEVSHRINLATPVTPTAIVCIALLAADRALTLDEVLDTVQPLARYLRSKSRATAGGANLTDRATVRRALQDLVKSGVLTSWHGDTTVWGIGPHQHLVAAVYRNSAIHVLVERAILELVLQAVSEAPHAVDALQDALRLRDLLKFEFFFAGRDQFAKDLQTEFSLIAPTELAHIQPPDAAALLNGLDLLVAPLALRPFLDAYALVAHQLAELANSDLTDEPRFIARCLIVGQQWALQRRIGSEESASGEMFQAALRLARQLDLVASNEPGLAARRAAIAAEIDGIRQRIDRLSRRAAHSP